MPGPAAGPGVVVIGGAVVLLGEARSLQGESDITYSFDTASRDADPRRDEGCASCTWVDNVADVRFINFTTWFFGLFSNAYVPLRVLWQSNGCDVKGAIFFFGAGPPIARLGHSVFVDVGVIETATTDDSGCGDCCERAACVRFKYTVTIKRPIQTPAIREGYVDVCGSGKIFPVVLS